MTCHLGSNWLQRQIDQTTPPGGLLPSKAARDAQIVAARWRTPQSADSQLRQESVSSRRATTINDPRR